MYTALEDDQVQQYLASFYKEYPDIKLNVVRDSTGTIVAKAIAEKDSPVADVFWGTSASVMEGTCGAISGAVAVAGAMNSSANLEKPDSKQSTYELSRQIIGKFREKNGATVCRELKGIETGTVLRPCQGCIEDACDILEEVIPETGD